MEQEEEGSYREAAELPLVTEEECAYFSYEDECRHECALHAGNSQRGL